MKDQANERILVKKIMQKDEKVFLSFVKAHEKQLYNYILRQLHDPEQSEEIVQDVFIDFLEALRNFQFQSSLKTFPRFKNARFLSRCSSDSRKLPQTCGTSFSSSGGSA